jgi:hypothetical protein
MSCGNSKLEIVVVGLVPTIQPSSSFGARGEMDPRDKPEDDTTTGWRIEVGA